MAVYTHLSFSDIADLLSQYNIGKLLSFANIESGTENSNYFITTNQNKFVLTIYEKRVKKEDLPFYLKLMNHLKSQDILCPTPLKTKDNHLLYHIKNKPCAIISFLPGKSVTNIQNNHLAKLGKIIALMHNSSLNFTDKIANHFSLNSWVDLFKQIESKVDKIKPGISQEIVKTLELLAKKWPTNLPSGIIHGDLFPDNVFFENDEISGIIDFYFSCYDFFMYDIAICLNAWCFEAGGEFNITKAKLLLTNYNKVRTITESELEALPILASGAALRFLLTRLYDNINKTDDALVKLKNPLEYLQKLRFHQNIISHAEYGL